MEPAPGNHVTGEGTGPGTASGALEVLRQSVLPGAVAGLVGGLVFGAAMSQLGVLPSIASLVRAESPVVGFIVHMAIAGIVGAGFGVLVWRQHLGAGELLFWGLNYGMLWWFLGPLTLMPLLLGSSVVWDIRTAQAAFPSLLGHLWYGASTALALNVLLSARRSQTVQTAGITAGSLPCGALAGVLGAWLLGMISRAQDQPLAFRVTMSDQVGLGVWLFILGIGVLAGLGFAVLYPRPEGSGPGLIRGVVYGFCWWFAGALTLIPVLDGQGLTWSLEAARERFVLLPVFLLAGAALALLYGWFSLLINVLFVDIRISHDQEGVGTQALRALGWGISAGAIGGLLFTLVMVQVGYLPAVASLMGGTSNLVGFTVHLAISLTIGASYGLLFRGQSYSLGSALGWGTSFGFFWWILGALTLWPVLLGAPPQWNIRAATEAFANLVGHLAYGAGLGVTFHLLAARYSPWWIPFRQIEARRIERRKEQLFTSAPALWATVVMLALILPILMAP